MTGLWDFSWNVHSHCNREPKANNCFPARHSCDLYSVEWGCVPPWLRAHQGPAWLQPSVWESRTQVRCQDRCGCWCSMNDAFPGDQHEIGILICKKMTRQLWYTQQWSQHKIWQLEEKIGNEHQTSIWDSTWGMIVYDHQKVAPLRRTF